MSTYTFVTGWKNTIGWSLDFIIPGSNTGREIPVLTGALKFIGVISGLHFNNLPAAESYLRSTLSLGRLAVCRFAQLKNSFNITARALDCREQRPVKIFPVVLASVSIGLFCVPGSSEKRSVRFLHFIRDHITDISRVVTLVSAVVLWKKGDKIYALGVVSSLVFSVSLVIMERYSIISPGTGEISNRTMLYVIKMGSILTYPGLKDSRFFFVVKVGRCVWYTLNLILYNHTYIKLLDYITEMNLENLKSYSEIHGISLDTDSSPVFTFDGITASISDIYVNPKHPGILPGRIDVKPVTERQKQYETLQNYSLSRLEPLGYIHTQLHGSLEERQKLIRDGGFSLSLKEALLALNSKILNEKIEGSDLANSLHSNGWLSHKPKWQKNIESIIELIKKLKAHN